MRVLSYLRMEINPDQIEDYEEDLEEMIWMARMTPGFLGVEVFRKRNSTNLAGTSVFGTSPGIHRELGGQQAGRGHGLTLSTNEHDATTTGWARTSKKTSSTMLGE